MGNITDLAGLTYVLAARNGANGEMTARICADADGEKDELWDSSAAVPS